MKTGGARRKGKSGGRRETQKKKHCAPHTFCIRKGIDIEGGGDFVPGGADRRKGGAGGHRRDKHLMVMRASPCGGAVRTSRGGDVFRSRRQVPGKKKCGARNVPTDLEKHEQKKKCGREKVGII